MAKNENGGILPHIAAPFLVFGICAGILTVALIKPYDKLKVYANLAFMDGVQTDPDNPSGLVIRDNDIITAYSGKTSSEGEVIRPKFGELYAILSSPALDLDVPVYWGSNDELLEHGACQSSGSVVVGEKGRSVISAHVDTFFADLGNLKEGDEVTVSTNYGRFTYKVSRLISFPSTDRQYVAHSDMTSLTLYTCKRDLFGSSEMRIGVICEPVKKAFYTDAKEADK